MTDGFARELFRSNMAAISFSADLAMFILPYIITYIIAEDQHADLVKTKNTLVHYVCLEIRG